MFRPRRGKWPAKSTWGRPGESGRPFSVTPGGSDAGPTVAAVTTDADRRRYDPPRLVEVLADGVWSPGTLSEWARWPGSGWRAYVRYSTGVGAGFVRWVGPEAIRPR